MTKSALLMILFLPLNAFAQRTKEQVHKLIHQGSEKVWLYDGTETVMKGSDRCENGMYYLFRSDKKVVIAECINNRWVKLEKSYSLKQVNSVDWFITIGEEEYYLVMIEIQDYDEIKLRRFDGISKADPAHDIILIHRKDD